MNKLQVQINKPYKIFAENLDQGTLLQFQKAMDIPENIQGALMADAHKGYVLPIGAVIKSTKIFPSYIGYDIGCTDKDTEYLTENGWIKISEYNNEKILQYNVETDIVNFAMPLAYIKKDCAWFNLINNKVVNQMLSDDHKILLFMGIKARGYKPRDFLTKDLLKKHKTLKKGVQGTFKTTFNLNSKGIKLSNIAIQLQIAISADGTIRKRKTIKNVVEFHLKKQRKIDRLLMLLKKANITPNIHIRKNGNFSCSFTPILPTKSLDFLWKANQAQLKIAANESKLWDGHIKNDKRFTFSSNQKSNIDLIQYAFAVNGIRTNFNKVNYTKENQSNWKSTYNLYSTNNNMVELPQTKYIQRVKSEDGKAYCFTTETGYWVQRRNGKISVTGNCGVVAQQFWVDNELDLEQLKQKILQNIPLSMNRHTKSQEVPNIQGTQFFNNLYKKLAPFQIGTLGGGNHFIEIGKSQKDNSYWIIIHSGSRNLGHKVATEYMQQAAIQFIDKKKYTKEFDNKNKKFKEAYINGKVSIEKYEKAKKEFIYRKTKASLNINVEKHYRLALNSKKGKDYIIDMRACLKFALANRIRMVHNIIKEIPNIQLGQFINRNHNHAEIVDGYVIHRKGATQANRGMYGVIPGNMRDGSFIVKGMGNSDSLNSSSHGAGRVYSRRKAKELLKFKDLQTAMSNIICNISEETLDESPNAYKNIFDVMDLQKDLVTVIDHIKPILNIKG